MVLPHPTSALSCCTHTPLPWPAGPGGTTEAQVWRKPFDFLLNLPLQGFLFTCHLKMHFFMLAFNMAWVHDPAFLFVLCSFILWCTQLWLLLKCFIVIKCGYNNAQLTIEYNQDLLPLCVANFRGLAEQDLVFVTDKDAVQDKLTDGDVRQIPKSRIFACRGEQIHSLLCNQRPV